jgi:hypothetical protein
MIGQKALQAIFFWSRENSSKENIENFNIEYKKGFLKLSQNILKYQ